MTNVHCIEMRIRYRLKKIGFKLVKRNGGYAILIYNELVRAWVASDGMFPIPYSLTLHDVIALTHEYWAEAEQEELAA